MYMFLTVCETILKEKENRNEEYYSVFRKCEMYNKEFCE